MIGGDGFNLLMHVHGWSASEALHFVVDYLDLEPDKQFPEKPRITKAQQDARNYAEQIIQIANSDIKNGIELSEQDKLTARQAIEVLNRG